MTLSWLYQNLEVKKFAEGERAPAARSLRLMTRMAGLAVWLSLGGIAAEIASHMSGLVPWTIIATLIYLLIPYSIRFLSHTWTRILFISTGNFFVFTFASYLEPRTSISIIAPITLALPALFFGPDEVLPSAFCASQTVLYFLYIYFAPFLKNSVPYGILPVQFYSDAAACTLIYFGVRYFRAFEASSDVSLRDVITSFPDLVFWLNRDGTFAGYHQPKGTILLLDAKDFLGKCYRDVLPGFLSKRLDDAWKELERTREPQLIEYELFLKDGVNHIYEGRVCYTHRHEILVVCQDVTSRRSAEKAIRDSEQLFRQMIETTQEGVWLLDEKLNTRFINDRLASILGYSREELLGRSPLEIVDPEYKDFFSQRLITRRQGIAERFDCKYRKKDGSMVWMLVSGTPILDDDKNFRGTLGMYVDITDRKRMEAEIISSSKMSALGVMSSGIAHEINNPLTIIHGRALQLQQLAKSDEPVNRSIVEQYARKIETTAIRISNIVKALRNFSRETGDDPAQNYDANAILTDTLELCRERLAVNGIEVQVISSKTPCMILCRPAEICQVVLNLLNNAHDAIQELPKKWVRLEVLQHDNSVTFSVTDSGHGIPENIRERIMQPFFTTKDVGKGTGLGLSVSKGIAESHGGELYLDAASANTRFVLTLPALNPDRRSQSS